MHDALGDMREQFSNPGIKTFQARITRAIFARALQPLAGAGESWAQNIPIAMDGNGL